MPSQQSASPDDKRPRHVAIIMDGNGRWAERRHLPRHAGHRAGAGAVRRVIEASLAHGVEVLTLFAFSSENWRRPPQEVALLMRLFSNVLRQETPSLQENDVRLRVVGDRGRFSEELQAQIRDAEAATRDNTRLTLNIAANYGGRWDIVAAARGVAERVARGELAAADVTEAAFEEQLSLSGVPDPDLFIRSGGEQRLSNFLLWQLAYAELYFTDVLWPDFDERVFEDALLAYARRQRRFGRTSAQVEGRGRA